MKNALLFLAASLALLLAVPAQSAAQGKIRIAIWDFENHAPTNYWYHDQLGPAARDKIDSMFGENPKLDSTFSVIERDKLNLVLKEQGLAQSGAVDPTTAAKVGKILGVKYIVLGGIDKFSVNNTKGGFGGIGGNLVQSDVTISMRFIDTTTAERVISISADGQVKKGGGFIKGASLSRDAEWGLASETIEKAAKEVATKFTTGDFIARLSTAAVPAGGLEGKIIKVDGTRAYINLGASSGIKVGDKFNVFAIGEALIDPDTGKKLGADEKQTGNGVVAEVQAEYAIMNLTGKGAAKDTIRKP